VLVSRRNFTPVYAAAAAAEGALNDIITKEEAISNTSIRLTVTVPSKMCKKSYQSVLKTWNDKIAITGYRKGHAPESVLVNQLGGQQRVNNTVLQELIENVMGTALEQTPSAQKAIADSERIEQTGEELEKAFDPNSNFTFSVLFDVLPSVTWITPYAKLAVKVSNPQNSEADIDAAVNKKFRMLLKEGASLRVVSGRGVQMGDVVIIDFSARVAESGEPIPGTDRKGMQLDTETADESFLPGVSSAMIGMLPGEEQQTTITFPSTEDFTPAALRGVTASIDIKLSEVFEWDLPQADDAWASKIMGPGCSMEDVKTRLVENTRAEKEDALRQRIQDAFTEAVAAAVSVDIPDSLIQEAGQNEYSRELNQLLTQGVLSYEQAEKLASPQLLAGYISRKRSDLVNLQKASLGFADILAKEGLIPSEADIEKELSSTLEAIEPVQGSQLDVNAIREQVVRGLETQAAMDWLLANCKVDVVA
jgi:trigger factor